MRIAIWLIAVALVATGCGKQPDQEMAAAQQALDTATKAEAKDYAPSSYAAAEDARVQMQAEVNAQAKKFVLFRSYGKAKKLAVETQAAAEKASADATAAKEKTRGEATRLIAEAKGAAAEVRDLLAKAPRGKGTTADIKALGSDIKGIEGAVSHSDSLFMAGRYLQAKARAEAAIEDARNVKNEITQAMEAKKKR